MQISAYSRQDLDSNAALWHSMLFDRKRVFVDVLGWELKLREGLYEIDEYDHADAVYVIVSDMAGKHIASQRLLPTTQPHLMRDHFRYLCMDDIPAGPEYYETTRVCISPDISGSALRRQVSTYLGLGVVEFALIWGLKGLLSVSYYRLMQMVISMGWDIEYLGLPCGEGKEKMIASNHLITTDSLRRVRHRWGINKPVLTMIPETWQMAA